MVAKNLLNMQQVAKLQDDFEHAIFALGWKKNSRLYYKIYGDRDFISRINFHINKKNGTLNASIAYSNMKLNDLAEQIRCFPEQEKETKAPISRQLLGCDTIGIDGFTEYFEAEGGEVQIFSDELNRFSDDNYKKCHTIEQMANLLDFSKCYDYPRQAAAKIALSVYFKNYDDAIDVINNFKNQTHGEWSGLKNAATIFLKRIGALPSRKSIF